MSAPHHPGLGLGFDLDLSLYLGVLRRRWLTIVLVLAGVLGATWYVTDQQAPLYRASTQFVVGSLVDPGGIASGGSDDALERILLGSSSLSTQPAAIESLPVAEAAAILLGGGRSPEGLLSRIDAQLTEELVLVVSAVSTDPQDAADIATAFVDAYLAVRDDEAIQRVVDASARVRARLEVVNQELEQLDAAIAPLEPAEVDPSDPPLLPNGEPSPTPSPSAELIRLRNQRSQVLDEVTSLERQLLNLDPSRSFESAGGQIIRPARAPGAPFSPQPVRNMGLALVLGLTLGLGLAFLRDNLDDAIRSESDLARVTGNVPVVGRLMRWRMEEQGTLVTVTNPGSPEAEAFRTLRTNVNFLTGESASVLVTSASVGEGKSTTASNLAMVYARLGVRALLIDADLRRPTVDRIFSCAREPGLSNLLNGDVEFADAVRSVDVANLRIVPAGTIPPNPSELLASKRFSDALQQLVGASNVVLIDAPPILAVSDTLAMAQAADVTILVVEQGRTRRSSLRAALAQLATIGVTPGGIVVNGHDPGQDGYEYAYYYRQEEPARRWWRRRSTDDATDPASEVTR